MFSWQCVLVLLACCGDIVCVLPSCRVALSLLQLEGKLLRHNQVLGERLCVVEVMHMETAQSKKMAVKKLADLVLEGIP